MRVFKKSYSQKVAEKRLRTFWMQKCDNIQDLMGPLVAGIISLSK